MPSFAVIYDAYPDLSKITRGWSKARINRKEDYTKFCILHKKHENPKDKEKYHSEANLFPKPVGFQLRPTTGEFRRQLNHKWSDSRRA